MSAYKAQPSQLQGFADSPYSPYSAQSFSTQQTDNAATQMNPMAFAANNAASAYLAPNAAPAAPGLLLNVLSCFPGVGVYGTRVTVKVSSSYDLQTMTAPEPFAWLVFGTQRCAGQLLKEVANGAFAFSISADAPQFLATQCATPNSVPVGIVVETASGEELARVDNAGTFTYQDVVHRASGSADANGQNGLGTRRSSQSPGQRNNDTTSPTNAADQGLQPDSAGTNSYDYPPAGAVTVVDAQAQAQAQAQPQFVGASPAYNAGATDGMLGAYRTSSFVDHYGRAPSALRSTAGAWSYGGAHIGSGRSPLTSVTHSSHTTIARPSLSQLSHPSGAPQLVRTSTLQQGASGVVPNSSYNPYALYPTKAQLKINGDLDAMTNNWTEEEWENRRRIVLFKKAQHGSQLTTTFRPVSVNERPPNSICISCIWWAEKNECYVTSVDTISLLEQLVAAPARFTVEEKNRIRRNLEGFHPLTVSKAKSESEEFFKVIMSFGNPKPRNIEKDVKVFPWKILGQALKKIISKYSASPSSTIAPSTPTHLLTPVSVSNSSYPVLPPTPGPPTTATDPVTATGYLSNPHHHHQPVAVTTSSPRAVPAVAVTSTWSAGYPATTAPSRTLSPIAVPKPSSPQSVGLRVSTLHGSYDTRPSVQPIPSPHSLSQVPQYSPHHSAHSSASYTTAVPVSQAQNTRAWEPYSVPDTYATGQGHSHTHSQGHAHAHAHGGVYAPTAAGYSDGVQRA